MKIIPRKFVRSYLHLIMQILHQKFHQRLLRSEYPRKCDMPCTYIKCSLSLCLSICIFVHLFDCFVLLSYHLPVSISVSMFFSFFYEFLQCSLQIFSPLLKVFFVYLSFRRLFLWWKLTASLFLDVLWGTPRVGISWVSEIDLWRRFRFVRKLPKRFNVNYWKWIIDTIPFLS